MQCSLATREISLGEVHPGKVGTTDIVSADGKRMGYIAALAAEDWDGRQRNFSFVVVDGVKAKEYSAIGKNALVFSPDSNRVGFAARRGSKWLIVIDGVEGKEYDGVGAGVPIFNPDSKRVAYDAERGDKKVVVVDGTEGEEFDAILWGPIFSPDSSRVAYAA